MDFPYRAYGMAKTTERAGSPGAAGLWFMPRMLQEGFEDYCVGSFSFSPSRSSSPSWPVLITGLVLGSQTMMSNSCKLITFLLTRRTTWFSMARGTPQTLGPSLLRLWGHGDGYCSPGRFSLSFSLSVSFSLFLFLFLSFSRSKSFCRA